MPFLWKNVVLCPLTDHNLEGSRADKRKVWKRERGEGDGKRWKMKLQNKLFCTEFQWAFVLVLKHIRKSVNIQKKCLRLEGRSSVSAECYFCNLYCNLHESAAYISFSNLKAMWSGDKLEMFRTLHCEELHICKTNKCTVAIYMSFYCLCCMPTCQSFILTIIRAHIAILRVQVKILCNTSFKVLVLCNVRHQNLEVAMYALDDGQNK
jgi:hypothetical protein